MNGQDSLAKYYANFLLCVTPVLVVVSMIRVAKCVTMSFSIKIRFSDIWYLFHV